MKVFRRITFTLALELRFVLSKGPKTRSWLAATPLSFAATLSRNNTSSYPRYKLPSPRIKQLCHQYMSAQPQHTKH